MAKKSGRPILSCFALSILFLFLVAYTQTYIFFGLFVSFTWWLIAVLLLRKELIESIKEMNDKRGKIHLISDELAVKVGEILLKSSTSSFFTFEFLKLNRYTYNEQDGVDAEESINLYFKATLKNRSYEASGWKDKEIMIKLIEKDRYHDYPYFSASSRTSDMNEHHYTNPEYITNYIEAIKFLQSENIL